uniref:cDENN domain-containing protein n=1 Tax=Globisporangium ultimum (strain ATCC 200006 / CBS 805.95 / DAOM BR144) TaxID=431595 RepID=K3WNG2_GLOUD
MWRDSKAKYTNGKLESSAFRTLNLRNLRTLLDTFDPHQVAVLYVGGVDNSSLVSSNGSNAGKVSTVNGCGIVGFDVAHINSYALIQDKNLVLSIGYDLDKGSHFGYSQLKFKVFSVKPGETSCWRSEIPRSDWYLKHYDQIEADCASPGVGALRTLRLLGPKILVKLLGLLLLENAIVVTGTSFPQVKEVALSLLKLLKPFRWQHTFVPFVCITSWRFLYDTCHLFSQAQLASRPKSRKSFSRLSSEWRWGSSSTASTLPSLGDALDFEDPPFLLGTTTETWQTCMVHAKSLGEDARTITSYVTVVDLDNLDTFTIAKNSPNAVGLPRKWRKHFLERFDKVVKQRRKVQYKTSRRMTRQLPPVPSTPGEMSATSTSQGGSIAQSSPNHQHHTADEYRHLDMTHRSVGDDLRSSRSASTWMSQGEAGLAPGGQLFVSSVLSAEATSASGPDDRLYYDMECFDAFMVLLHDFYNKLVSLCEEKDKKMLKSGHKKKKSSGGLSKRQEIKAWFSSSHDFDAFVDKFQESEVYLEFEKDKELQAAAAAATSTTTGSERVHSQSGYSESGSTAPGSATHTSSSHFVTLSARSSGGSSGTAILGARTPHQLKSASSMSSVSSAGMGL